MMRDTSHLVALHEGLCREKERLGKAKTEHERQLRRVWIMQREREIANEMRFLGMAETPAAGISDDDLLTELEA